MIYESLRYLGSMLYRTQNKMGSRCSWEETASVEFSFYLRSWWTLRGHADTSWHRIAVSLYLQGLTKMCNILSYFILFIIIIYTLTFYKSYTQAACQEKCNEEELVATGGDDDGLPTPYPLR